MYVFMYLKYDVPLAVTQGRRYRVNWPGWGHERRLPWRSHALPKKWRKSRRCLRVKSGGGQWDRGEYMGINRDMQKPWGEPDPYEKWKKACLGEGQ